MSDFPWLKKYPKGILYEIGPLEYQSLNELFDSASKKFSDKIYQVSLNDNYAAGIYFFVLVENDSSKVYKVIKEKN